MTDQVEVRPAVAPPEPEAKSAQLEVHSLTKENEQIQLGTYDNLDYRGGSTNNYYYGWSGADALKAAAYWLRQPVTPDLRLLHVSKEGHTQWILNDRRLCDQGVEPGDAVVLLSTSYLSQRASSGDGEKSNVYATMIFDK